MLVLPMPVRFLCCAALVGSLGCARSRPALAPVVLAETAGLEAEVLQLVEQKVAAVRAAPSDARAHADLALVYEANGLFEPAWTSFAQALALDDSRPIWLYHRALALHEGGQGEPALAELRRAAQRLPDEPAVQQRLGQWLLERGDPAGAAAAFQQALARRPDQPEYLTGLASCELQREHWSEAETLARRALKRSPGYRPAVFAVGQALQGEGRGEEAKAFLAAGVNAQLSWTPDELTRAFQGYARTTSAISAQAASAGAAGDYASAAELLERLVARSPADVELLNNLGAALMETGRAERAQEVLQKALELDPRSFAAHLNLSELYLRQQRLGESLAEAARAVEIGGNVGRTHFQLARLLMRQGDLTGAYRELNSAAALDARDVGTFLALTDTARRLARLDEARGWCRKALELDPSSVPGHGLRGTLAATAGDFDEARAALVMLERIAPQDPRTAALRTQLQEAGH
jgi:tetratricopeptide (TPR) repeat protein